MSNDLDNPPEEARPYVELYERTAKERTAYRLAHAQLQRQYEELRLAQKSAMEEVARLEAMHRQQVTKLCELSKDRWRQLCDVTRDLESATSARDHLFRQLQALREATMLDPPDDDWAKLTPEHLRQHIQDLADLRDAAVRERDAALREVETVAEIVEREAMHVWFGLSYSSYLVLHRTAIQTMPDEWQARMVKLLDEMETHIDTSQFPGEFQVRAKKDGKYVEDPWSDYQRGRRKAPLREPDISQRNP